MSKGQEPYLSCWLLCLQHIYVAGARHLLNERMPPPPSEHRGSGSSCKFLSSTSKHWSSRRWQGTKSWRATSSRLSQGSGECWRRLAQVLPLPIISSPRSQRGFKSQTQNQATGNLEQTPTWTGVPRSWIANVET